MISSFFSMLIGRPRTSSHPLPLRADAECHSFFFVLNQRSDIAFYDNRRLVPFFPPARRGGAGFGLASLSERPFPSLLRYSPISLFPFSIGEYLSIFSLLSPRERKTQAFQVHKIFDPGPGRLLFLLMLIDIAHLIAFLPERYRWANRPGVEFSPRSLIPGPFLNKSTTKNAFGFLPPSNFVTFAGHPPPCLKMESPKSEL